MLNKKYSFLIAAPSSGSGKTTVTLGLMYALKNRGYEVQPFKCGPDFIDTMYHSEVTGLPSYNLDCKMASEEHVKELFTTKSSNADISVVEGVMGMFDGAVKDYGSSAYIAKLLNIPVILVVDAKSMAHSAAALLYGFKNFNTQVNLAGVIFNKVGSESHYTFLKEAAIDAGVTPLGYIERKPQLVTPSRHLGLSMPHENNLNSLLVDIEQSIIKNIDLDKLLCISETKPLPQLHKTDVFAKTKDLKIAIAHDEAFNFMYRANVEALMHFGQVTFFSPLRDLSLPCCDLVWLPGGYPELFADKLSKNEGMLASIRKYVNDNKPLIAECGGFIYLGKSLFVNNTYYPMAGVMEHIASMNNAKLTLGYRSVEINGCSFSGHEFHYSTLTTIPESASFKVKNARDIEVEMPVYLKNRCLASYMHFYCGEVQKMGELLNVISIK